MTTPVVVDLSDELVQRAASLAERSGRDVSEVLRALLEITLTPEALSSSRSIDSLSDEQVMALADSRMDAGLNEQLNGLLDKNREGQLDALEARELSLLMHLYQEGSLQKARALAEAVRRGLRKPLGE